MPKRTAQNVCCSGIVTVPFSESALKMRSASAGSVTPIVTEKPFGASYRSGGMSPPISTASPTTRRA